MHYFFVPYRLLWSDWEKFITGGEDGTFTATLPRWTPTSNAVGSLWDYMGMPTGVTPSNRLPLDFPKRAYNFIWNSFYRDETLQTALDINTSDTILRRAWEKDYFTSSLPWQQRGIAPALPISGMTSAQWSANVAGTATLGSGNTVRSSSNGNALVLHSSGSNPAVVNFTGIPGTGDYSMYSGGTASVDIAKPPWALILLIFQAPPLSMFLIFV